MEKTKEVLPTEMLVQLSTAELRRIISEEVNKAVYQVQSKLSSLNTTLPSDLMTRKDLVSYFRISLPTLYRWIKSGILPEPIHKGGRIYFRRSEIENFKNKKK